MAKQRVDLLYEAASQDYDLGTRDEFVSKLQDPNKRKALYDAIGEQYQLGTFDEFSNKVVEKKNPNTPMVSSGMGVSMAGKGSSRSVLGNYGISTKPVQKEAIKGVPASVANPKLQKEAGIKPKEQFSNLNDLNKQVVETVTRVEGNRQKDIASMTGGAKGLLEKANDVIVATLTSGTASVLSGVAGLVGSVADLSINKTPQKKAPFLSNEWFQSKIPVIQQGEVADPAWWSNQGIRDKMMSLSENLSKISTGELGVAKTEIGLENSAKSSIDYIIEGDYKNGAKSALVDIGQQIPQLVAMAMSGGSTATLGVMGASSAGSNMAQQYQQDGDISVLDFAQGASVGLAETLSEKVFNLDIKALGKIGGKVADFLGDSGKALQKQIQEEGVDVVKDKLIRSFGGALKEAGMGTGQEILEENIVSTVDYLTKALDEDVFNKKGFEEFTKELGQNMIVAGPTGGGASLLAATASLKPLTKEEKVKISQYEQVLNNENSSKEVKQIAKQRIDAINNGSNTESEALYDQVMTLPIENRVQVIDKLNTIKKIEAEAESLPLELKEDAAQTVAQLREQVNFALNPKEAEIQGDNRGVEAVIETTNSMVEKSMPQVQEMEAKMNNAELIDEAEIKSTTDGLYDLLDQVEQLEVKDEVKYGMITAIEEKIKKIEGYEFETTTQTSQPGQTKTVPVGIKIIGSTKRGSRSKNEVTPERLNKTSVTAIDGTTGEKMNAEFVFSDGKLDVIDRKVGTAKVFDTGRLEYSETNLDEDGNVQSIALTDNTTGDIFTINDPDIALDLSIQEKTRRLGDINDGIFEQVYQEVDQAPVVTTTIKPKNVAVPVVAVPKTSIPSPKVSAPKPIVAPPPPSGKVTTPEQAAALSEQMINEEQAALREHNKKVEKDRSWFTAKKWIDRQANIRKELNRVGAKVTEAFMTNVSGAKAYADKRFENVEKDIYKGIDIAEEKQLDQIILHERVRQIDQNFDDRKVEAEIKIETLEKELKKAKDSLPKNPLIKDLKVIERIKSDLKKAKENVKERPKHPKGFNLETSTLALEGIKANLGDEKFAKLKERADMYFSEFNKLLEEEYKAGLLDKETYDRFKKDKYIPRRFLKDLLVDRGTSKISPIAEKSLTKDQIKTIEGGSETLLFTDSRVLLNAAMRSSASRIAQNYASRALAETVLSIPDNAIGKEANYTFSKGVIKTDAFGDKVARDPDPGYTNIKFFNEKGEWDTIQVKSNLANEFLDVERQFDDFDPVLKTVLLNGVLKAMATGINPTFFISNVPVDFLNTILFTNVFDDTNIFNASRKLAQAFTKNAYNYSKLEAGGKVDPVFKQNYTEWVENGGMMQFLTDQGRPDEVAKRDAEIRNRKSFMPLNKAKKAFVNSLAFSGEVSEKAMRLAIFEKLKNDLVKEAGGMGKISDAKYKELLAQVAAGSRKTMDFAQGGLFAKKSDVFLLYLNAAIQGLRVSVEYVINNPKKFITKAAQAAVPIAALQLYNLSVMDDEDEWQDIPPHERENYFIILKPWKNEEGKREYGRIKKHPSIQWFATGVEHATIGAWELATGKEVKKGDSFLGAEWESLNNALPIPLDWKKVLSKAPASLQGALAYITNFDLFRNEEISKDFGEVLPVLEGKYDKNVPLFYKKFGELTGASPKRTQAAVEKVVTNPGTNAIVGLAYSLMDNVVTVTTGKPKIGTESKYQDTSPKGIGDIFKARIVREINPEYSNFKNNKAKQLELELKSQDKEIKNELKSFIKAGKSNKEIIDHIKSIDLAVEEKPRLLKFVEDQLKLEKAKIEVPNAETYIDLKYDQDPRIRAFNFFEKFGIVDNEGKRLIMSDVKKLGFKLFGNERFDAEYNKLVKEYEDSLKNKQK